MSRSVSILMIAAAGFLLACPEPKPLPDAGIISPLPGATEWALNDLGEGRCVAANDRGQALGVDPSNETFIAAVAQPRVKLGKAPDGSAAIGSSINVNGAVVGYSVGQTGKRALLFSEGSWRFLDDAAGGWSSATGISDRGSIVGMNGAPAHSRISAFLLVDGTPVDLKLNVPNSIAYAEGSPDRVIGVFQASAGTHAFLTTAEGFKDLGTFGGPNSAPYGINRQGDVVGAAETAQGQRHAFVARAGGALEDLGVPSGFVSSEARGISGTGQIAGNVFTTEKTSSPVVFVAGKDPLLLAGVSANTYESAYVVGVSPQGKIVGWGLAVGGDAGASRVRCLLWTPVGGGS